LEHKGLWDEETGFYHDQLRLIDGTCQRVRSFSVVGLLPLTATAYLSAAARASLPSLMTTIERLIRFRQADLDILANVQSDSLGNIMLSVVPTDRIALLLSRMLDPAQFLSDHGIRSLSRIHRDAPLELTVGGVVQRLDYEPAESTTALFGGNSNWRGPVWFPVNYLLIEALRRLHDGLGTSFTVECPTGSGDRLSLTEVADGLSDRLIRLFLRRADATRPCYGGIERLQHDPAWSEHLTFHEYFHGDNGAGLGASHQTGWTALVALLIIDHRSPPTQAV
jgi:hypothetical protein